MKYLMSLLLFLLLFNSGISGAETANQIDDVYYASKPVNMIISVQKDSLIYFPNPVKVKDDYLNFADVVVTNDVIVIRALKEFQSRRFIFQDLKTEKVFLFNVSANNAKNPRHIRLLMPGDGIEDSETVKSSGNAYVSLSQHAAMSIYYPKRYSPNTRGIREVRLESGDANYLISFNGKAEPIQSWKGFGLFVTAVKITNLEPGRIDLDPRIHYRGNWLFASPQHGWLAPYGQRQDNVTTVYFVSERPFWEALL